MYVRDRVSLALPRHVGPISITNIECDAVIPLSVITWYNPTDIFRPAYNPLEKTNYTLIKQLVIINEFIINEYVRVWYFKRLQKIYFN